MVRKRMSRAAEEAGIIERYDYIMINDEVEESVKRLHSLIEAAHFTPGRNEEFIRGIQNDLVRLWKGEE